MTTVGSTPADAVGADAGAGKRSGRINLPDRVAVGGVFLTAASMYRRFPARVVGTALLVFPLVMVLEAVVHELAQHASGEASTLALGSLLTASSGVAIAFGELMFAGVMDESVGAAFQGARMPTVLEILRSLPLRTLLVADLVLLLATVAAASLLVGPAVVIVTLTSIAGPIVIVERRSAMASLRRSSALVWPHFWTAFAAVAVPISIEGGVVELAIERAGGAHAAFVVAAAGGALGVTIGAFIGLCEVVLGRTLLVLDGSPEHGSDDPAVATGRG